MSAADTLRRLRAEGFSFEPDGSRLIVRPASRLTDDIRDELRYFRAELLELLAAERDAAADHRVTCQGCAHYRPTEHHCGNHRAALLTSPVIAPALARLRQHCPGHTPKPANPATASPEPISAGHDASGKGSGSPETAPGRPPGNRQATPGHPEPASSSQDSRLTERTEPKDPHQHSRLTGQGSPSAELSPGAPPCTYPHRAGGANA